MLIGVRDPATTPRPPGPLTDIAVLAGGEHARLLDEGAPRGQLFRASLRDLAESVRSTLVIVEDAHWADEAPLDWLRYLGRQIGALPALFLVTY